MSRSAGFRELMDRVYALIRRCERRVPGPAFWAIEARVCDEALLAMTGLGTFPALELDICLGGEGPPSVSFPCYCLF